MKKLSLNTVVVVVVVAAVGWFLLRRPQVGGFRSPLPGAGAFLPRPDLNRPGAPPQFGVRLPTPDFLQPNPGLPRAGMGAPLVMPPRVF